MPYTSRTTLEWQRASHTPPHLPISVLAPLFAMITKTVKQLQQAKAHICLPMQTPKSTVNASANR
jgi:hypothetical protein